MAQPREEQFGRRPLRVPQLLEVDFRLPLLLPQCVHLLWEAFLLTNEKLGLGRTVEFNIVVKHYCDASAVVL